MSDTITIEEQAVRRRRAPAAGLPSSPVDTARILSWIYLARVALAIAILFRLPGTFPPPLQGAVSISILLLVTALFTGLSYGFSRSRPHAPARLFIYGQIVFDAFLLTAVVYFTGGPRSMFAPLYILVISAGALLLPIVGGILIGLLASVLYFGAAVTSTGVADYGTLLHAGLFAIVALVTGYLGDRLRQTGAQLGEVQTELRRLRLDTDEILETIGTGILTVDGGGRLAYLNPAAAEMLSLRPAEWLDRPILEQLDRIAPGLGGVVDRTAATGTPVRRYETEPLEGVPFVLGVSTTVLERWGEGRPPVTAIFQDITEKVRAEALRRRAERLEAVAELSASLAHEIKNPLASIRSAVEQIAGGRVAPDDSRLLGGVIVRESDRLSRLLGEFIDFARVKVTSPEPVDLGVLVQHVVEVVRAHPDGSERGVTIDYSGPADAVLVRGEEDILHRAVLNLALNGVQWAGEGGCVEFSLDEVRSDLLSPALGAFRLVRLSVRDTGPGVPEEIRDQIFDPFFTRRPGGSGLGLALVQRAVEAHGGAIFVDDAEGRGAGAVFSLYLPSLPLEEVAETAAVCGSTGIESWQLPGS
jgi:two-component system, NtrC family, sensor histidine kinase PilS